MGLATQPFACCCTLLCFERATRFIPPSHPAPRLRQIMAAPPPTGADAGGADDEGLLESPVPPPSVAIRLRNIHKTYLLGLVRDARCGRSGAWRAP